MYVLLDYHPMEQEYVSHNATAFVEGWTGVWGAVTGLPSYAASLKGRVMLDVMNEPDSQGLRWEAQVGGSVTCICMVPARFASAWRCGQPGPALGGAAVSVAGDDESMMLSDDVV